MFPQLRECLLQFLKKHQDSLCADSSDEKRTSQLMTLLHNELRPLLSNIITTIHSTIENVRKEALKDIKKTYVDDVLMTKGTRRVQNSI